jgi:hypothetical protein
MRFMLSMRLYRNLLAMLPDEVDFDRALCHVGAIALARLPPGRNAVGRVAVIGLGLLACWRQALPEQPAVMSWVSILTRGGLIWRRQ